MNLSILRISTLLLLAALASAATLGAATAAFGDTAVPYVRVKISDLDLSKPAGTEALYRRLKSAASVVCSTYEDRLPALYFPWKACVNGALDRAVEEVANAQLTAYHLAKTARSASAPAYSRPDADAFASATPAANAN